MKIRDGDWTLFDYDVKAGRQVWVMSHPDGSKTFRTDYMVQPVIDENQAVRNLAQGGWKGDWHHVGRIPNNIYFDQLHEAQQQGDERYLRKWLNDSDNRAWRTKDGTL